jgi:DNA-binding transcriptional ArsR family regulator
MPLQRASVAAAKAELFKALGHPIRVRALEVLVGGERPVGELAEELGVEMSHLSQQLAVLRRAQIVTARRVRSTVFYSVRDPRIAQLFATARAMLVDGLRDRHALLADLEGDELADTTDDAVRA